MSTFQVTAVEVSPDDRTASCSEPHGAGKLVFAADLEEAERGDRKVGSLKGVESVISSDNGRAFFHVETVEVKGGGEAAGVSTALQDLNMRISRLTFLCVVRAMA